MNWKNEQLIDWIRKTSLAWSYSTIRDLEQDYPEHGESLPGIRQFVYLVEHTSRSIDPDTIVGQWNHYAGQTWLGAILEPNYKPGKMRDCLSRADSNPSYYFNKLHDIQLTSFDGKNWYSHTSGNHRTVIGKFIMAMAEAQIGMKQHFSGVSTIWYHVDHECFNMYQKLALLIQKKGLQMTLDARSEPKKMLSNEFEIKISVQDNRMGFKAARYGWLSAREFCKFAKWVIEHDGEYPIWYRVKQTFGLVSGFEQRRLVYPGMSGEYLSAPRTLR